MKTIWKKQIEVTDVQVVEVPHNSTFLCVQVQNEVPCIWYLVPDTETELRDQIQLMIFETGNPIPDVGIFGIPYLGTFQMHGGQIWHLFGKAINSYKIISQMLY